MDPTRTMSDALRMQDGLDEATLSSLVVPYKADMDALLAPTKPSDAEFVSAAPRRDRAGRGEPVRLHHHRRTTGLPDVVLKCFDLADVYVLLTTLDMPALKTCKVTLDTLDNLGFPQEQMGGSS